MTQEELGEKIGVVGSSVSKWERGITAPDITLLKFIAKELDITVEELLDGKVENKARKINVKIFISILCILSILILMFTFLVNEKKESVYIIYSKDKSFSFRGHIMIGKENSILSLNDFKLLDLELDKKVNYFKLELKNSENIIAEYYCDNFGNESELYLSKILDDVYLELIDTYKNETVIIDKELINSLSLYLEYLEIDGTLNKSNLLIEIGKQN